MKHAVEHIFVFSAELDTLPPLVNAQRSVEVDNYLTAEAIPFKRVIGRGGNREERSFVVVGEVHYDTVRALVWMYDQESYLERFPDGFVTERYSDGRPSRNLGRWTELSEREARTRPNTYDPSTGLYWGCSLCL